MLLSLAAMGILTSFMNCLVYGICPYVCICINIWIVVIVFAISHEPLLAERKGRSRDVSAISSCSLVHSLILQASKGTGKGVPVLSLN